jgi:hypothetical protein
MFLLLEDNSNSFELTLIALAAARGTHKTCTGALAVVRVGEDALGYLCHTGVYEARAG